MKLIKRKTRKAIEKSVAKALKDHGPAIATGIAAILASSIVALISTDDTSGKAGGSKKGRKGRMGKLASLLPKEAIGKALAGVPGLEQVAEMMRVGKSASTPAASTSTASGKKASRRKSSSKRGKKQPAA